MLRGKCAESTKRYGPSTGAGGPGRKTATKAHKYKKIMTADKKTLHPSINTTMSIRSQQNATPWGNPNETTTDDKP